MYESDTASIDIITLFANKRLMRPKKRFFTSIETDYVLASVSEEPFTQNQKQKMIWEYNTEKEYLQYIMWPAYKTKDPLHYSLKEEVKEVIMIYRIVFPNALITQEYTVKWTLDWENYIDKSP